MIKAKYIECYDFDINDVTSIEIGRKTALDSPNYQVVIYIDEKPAFLLKIFLSDETDCFHDVKCSNNFVVVGCGEKVHFFSIDDCHIRSYQLNDYFGHLYPSHDIEVDIIEKDVLVTSASQLFKFKPDGQLEWESETVGIDGVVIDEINENVIRGAGEYDPPAGWREFKVQVGDGKIAR